MNTRVLRRFIFLMFCLTVGGFIFWDLVTDFVDRPPGDYHTEVGDLRLRDGLYDEFEPVTDDPWQLRNFLHAPG